MGFCDGATPMRRFCQKARSMSFGTPGEAPSPTRQCRSLLYFGAVTVERIDGGKLRCTGATWRDAIVILPGEVLAFQNIERQAHALRAPAVVEKFPHTLAAAAPPRAFGEDDFEGGLPKYRASGARPARAGAGSKNHPPSSGGAAGFWRGRFRGGKNEPSLSSASTAASCGATWDDAVRAPLLQGGSAPPHFGEDDSTAPPDGVG